MRILWDGLKWVWSRIGDLQTFQGLLPAGAASKAVPLTVAAMTSVIGVIGAAPIVIWIPAAIFSALGALKLTNMLVSLQKRRREKHISPQAPSNISKSLGPEIEILFRSGEPYERVEIVGAGIMSKIGVGIVNSGGGILSNCVVQIVKIAPPQHLYGGLPMQLHLESFTLRADDPARAVEVAYRTKGSNQFRFAVPYTGGFEDTLNFLDTKETLTIEIRVTATECQRAAIFNVWTDDDDHLRMKFLSYVD